jgi:cytidyltransferase-like protein
MNQENKQIIVAVSGGFDPIHIGHIRLIQEAKKLGDKMVVILNNDHWLRKKKGFVFMPQEERLEVIRAISGVDEVIFTEHLENPEDMSVCAELRKIRPHIFANGGDRHPTSPRLRGAGGGNTPEAAACEEINCKMVYNVGAGGKVQSSSWLVKNYEKNKPE